MNCYACRRPLNDPQAPPEPPVGTWVRDRFGGLSVRIVDSEGNDGWAPAPNGFYAFGKWSAMWEAKGPLVECQPWGKDTA